MKGDNPLSFGVGLGSVSVMSTIATSLSAARMALTLAYDGGRFCGWQTQPNQGAIQDLVQQAVSQIAGTPTVVVCAGRTDAGVHAACQVVHLDVPCNCSRPLSAWVRGVNRFLPTTIAVQQAIPVAPHFHARFSATRRRYRYLLYRSSVRHPLWSGRAGWIFRPLCVARMAEAAAALIGEHDFSAFRSAQCQAKSPIRRLERLILEEQGAVLIFTFTANSFLHHMIRNIIGSLLVIGSGARPVTWSASLLASRNRQLAAPTFSPDGLYLDGIEYPAEFGIPSWETGPLMSSLASPH